MLNSDISREELAERVASLEAQLAASEARNAALTAALDRLRAAGTQAERAHQERPGVHCDPRDAEQARAEGAVRESEARLRLALKAASLVAWEWEIASNRTVWIGDPDLILGTVGLADGGLVAMNALISPGDLALIQERVFAVAPGEELRHEHPYRRVDGTTGWVETYASVMACEDGRPSMLIGMSRDITPRKQLEQTLQESERRLRLAVEAAEIGIFEIDLSTGTVTISQQLARVLGIDHDTLSFPLERLLEVVHPDDLQAARAAIARTLSAGTRSVFEARIVQQHGSVRWIRSVGQYVQDGDAALGRIVGALMDITHQLEAQEAAEHLNADLEARVLERTWDLEMTNRALRYEIEDRERAESALLESRRFLERVMAASPSLVSILDLAAMQIAYTNAPLADLLGYAPGELDRLSDAQLLERLMHPDDLAGIPEQIRRQLTMADDQVLEREFRMRYADGSWRWFGAYDVVFSRDADNRPTQILGQMFDITSRKQVEADLAAAFGQLDALNSELLHSHNLLRTIVNSLDDGLVLIGADGRVLMVNRAMAAFCRIDASAIVGRPWREVCPFQSALIDRALTQVLAFSGRERILRDGANLTFDIRAIPLGAEVASGQMVLHLVDVTERLHFEELALKNERLSATGRLAATVAHEVNSPLQAIQNILFLAASDDPAERDTYLGMVAEEIDRIGGLIRRLLDLQRPGDDAVRSLDANVLIEKVLAVTSSTMSRHRVQVTKDLVEGPALVEGRSDQLTQVLLNLTLNALDTMPHGGELTICSRWSPYDSGEELAASETPQMLEIEVADTGHGIPAEALPRIFEPFFTTKTSGSGLGLAISRQLVEQHGGRLSAKNRAPRGAVFTVALPALAPESGAPSA